MIIVADYDNFTIPVTKFLFSLLIVESIYAMFLQKPGIRQKHFKMSFYFNHYYITLNDLMLT